MKMIRNCFQLICGDGWFSIVMCDAFSQKKNKKTRRLSTFIIDGNRQPCKTTVLYSLVCGLTRFWCLGNGGKISNWFWWNLAVELLVWIHIIFDIKIVTKKRIFLLHFILNFYTIKMWPISTFYNLGNITFSFQKFRMKI